MNLLSSIMRSAVLLFMAGFCASLGSIFLLLSLGTDYWLLASESCDPELKNQARLRRVAAEDSLRENLDGGESTVLSYHEGIFWRCFFKMEMDREESILDFWITNQASGKICMPSYLSHLPLSGVTTTSSSDSSTVYRSFWCIMSMLALTMVLTGVFVTICGIPASCHRLYEAGGAIFITGGLLFLMVVVTFAAWVQTSDALEHYVLQRRQSSCAGLQLIIHYGPSFMLAPVSCFFCLLCGLLLMFIRTDSRAECANGTREPLSMREECEVSTL